MSGFDFDHSSVLQSADADSQDARVFGACSASFQDLTAVRVAESLPAGGNGGVESLRQKAVDLAGKLGLVLAGLSEKAQSLSENQVLASQDVTSVEEQTKIAFAALRARMEPGQ